VLRLSRVVHADRFDRAQVVVSQVVLSEQVPRSPRLWAL
jgi:hypothetical protein